MLRPFSTRTAKLKDSRLRVVTMGGLVEEEAVEYLKSLGFWKEARAGSLTTIARRV